jgi:hypothetical protein
VTVQHRTAIYWDDTAYRTTHCRANGTILQPGQSRSLAYVSIYDYIQGVRKRLHLFPRKKYTKGTIFFGHPVLLSHVDAVHRQFTLVRKNVEATEHEDTECFQGAQFSYFSLLDQLSCTESSIAAIWKHTDCDTRGLPVHTLRNDTELKYDSLRSGKCWLPLGRHDASKIPNIKIHHNLYNYSTKKYLHFSHVTYFTPRLLCTKQTKLVLWWITLVSFPDDCP